MKKFSVLLSVGILILINTIVFSRLAVFDFVNFDDAVYVYENALVIGGITLSGIKTAFTSIQVNFWHPLTIISHMLDCQLFGLNPGMHHLTSLFFHIGNSILLMLCFYYMTGFIWRSFFTAALFAIHPFHVEAVAMIAQRKDVLSTFFWLLTMITYFLYTKRPAPFRYILFTLMFVLGMMAKPMLVTLPFVLLLLDFWPIGRIQLTKKGTSFLPGFDKKIVLNLVLEKAPLFLMAFSASILAYLAEGVAVSRAANFPLLYRIQNVLLSYGTYFYKTIIPVNFSVFYPYPVNIPFGKIVTATILIISGCIFSIRKIEKYPYIFWGWFWFLGTLIPVSGIVQVGDHAMADRYTYIPLIGLFIIISWGSYDLVSKLRKGKELFPLLALIITGCLMAITYKQVSVWKNGTTLFSHAIRATDNNMVAMINLGDIKLKKGELAEAISLFRDVIKSNPDKIYKDYKLYAAVAYSKLGYALMINGETAESIQYYRKALETPGLPFPYFALKNMGDAYYKLGKIPEAVYFFKEALRIKPDFGGAHYSISIILAQSNLYDEALVHFRQAAALKPGKKISEKEFVKQFDGMQNENDSDLSNTLTKQKKQAVFYYNLANYLIQHGKYEEAILNYKKVLNLEPGNVMSYNNLGFVYEKQGNLEKAITMYQKASTLKPEHANTHNNLGNIKVRQGKFKEAMEYYENTLKYNPEHKDAKYNRKMLLDYLKKQQK